MPLSWRAFFDHKHSNGIYFVQLTFDFAVQLLCFKRIQGPREHSSTPSTCSRSSRSVTPILSPSESLPTTPAISDEPGTSYGGEVTQRTSQVIDQALLARIEILESENAKIKEESSKKQNFRIEDIQNNDKLVSFYAGFVSFMVFSAFFEFLGPVVYNLNYWGSKERITQSPPQTRPKEPTLSSFSKIEG